MFVTAQQLEQQMPDATRLLSDEPEMETSLHYMQLLLLVTSLEWLWQDKNDFFIGANLTIYFSPEGELIPTPEEAARLAQEQAKQAQQAEAKANQSELRSQRLEEQLRKCVRVAFS
ncbi:MAG: Uma2 family endonuclease [Methylacidiphilales bacterium]|nr:Uma2 family endonuclease [Candidatus Methylacidiphilales bacterium]NJR15849.1 Uma2 family endonuclease [Calothrix sp. CSU_2_0]